jgi:hypothetical protein
MIAIRARTNSDGSIPNNGNGQYSMTECIEIRMDTRSNSIDSHSESISGSLEDTFYITNRERKNSTPIIDILLIKSETNKEKVDRRRIRDMKIYGKSPDEPKTIEQVKNELYIFNAKYCRK